MARTAALGDGPIAFFAGGAQIEVPLSAIYFENDVVHTNRTDLASLAGFNEWIAFLASRGRLVAGVAPPVESAMVVTAVAPGSPGNNIQVEIKGPTNGAATMVDVAVTETDRYEGLTLASLLSQLGTSTTRGSNPGLLCLRGTIPPNAPDPTAGDILVTTTGANPPTWKIAGAEATTGPQATPSTAVILEPRTSGDAASDIKVSIKDVVPPATGTGATFTLIVSWTKNLPNVALSGLLTTLNTSAGGSTPFGYLVNFAPPSGGANPPRRGKVLLSGGNELVAATPAAAIVMAAD